MAHWANQARQWELLGSPLKPSLIDIEKSSTWIQKLKPPLSVLVLGVTPEIINIDWPPSTELFAIDYNMAMLRFVLPTATPCVKPKALLGNWLQLPFATSSIDLVIGDGCYNSLAYQDYPILSAEIKRVLKTNGTLIMRFFSKPDTDESIALIQQDLSSGNLRNFHAFKLRLAIALQQHVQTGICLQDIWNSWHQNFAKAVHHHKQALQWSDEIIGSIDTYKESQFIYTFPTLEEIKCGLGEDFIEEDIFIPDYQPTQSCPSFNLTLIK